ncbi:MAG: DUF3326 domain-containing protein [Gammaproteobacteria bacterium]|nr:DUF3326 domain-containing protein [Gammaproteobacteria bacterium]MDE0246437.1 DUF3326 domain-containing protein [Gammaproteobacteria bacterium]
MGLLLREQSITIESLAPGSRLLEQFRRACDKHGPPGGIAIRIVVSLSGGGTYQCEVGVLRGAVESCRRPRQSIFEFRRRAIEDTRQFNAVLVIPTGIGAEIGGHAGDAGPVAKMLGEVCDTVVLHPNVVNASDINEMPDNALYVEGSVLTRLLMGTVGLQPVRANCILVVMDAHEDEMFINAGMNAVNAARAAWGMSCSGILLLESRVRMRAGFSESGRSTGVISNIDGLCELLEQYSGQYDAVALSSIIDVPHEYHQGYFDAGGGMVNPWGGVEAMLTHALSSVYDLPTAHSPMFESREIADMDPGVVDPRMAAEAYSTTFLQCTLKGLHRSPRIITDVEAMGQEGVLGVEDISCLVIPAGCLGLPTLAALEQGIPVIAVKENHNLMKNRLAELPWAVGQFREVDNYWEAAGVIAAMRAGVNPASIRRPFPGAMALRSPAIRSGVRGQVTS